MATYKLIQDIEAEDKILGPLTLRQFIFALIAVFLFYLCFIVVVKHLFFLLVILLPPALFCGFFALPFGRDQPTEIWALAKLRFWFKPRQRVWNQSGIKEMVTITVPKKVERVLTNGLSPTEVSSRLQVLADTLDSRGWAVKHAESDIYTSPVASTTSDRLVSFDNLPQEVPNGDSAPANDMLDETTNPIARQFDSMINQSSQTRRQALLNQLNDVRQVAAIAPAGPQGGNNRWFMRQAAGGPVMDMPVGGASPVISVVESPEDSALSARLASRATARQGSLGNLRTVRTASQQITAPADDFVSQEPPVAAASDMPANGQSTTMTASDDPAILSLARNDDLNVATLAREANKNKAVSSRAPDEVVISLH